MARVTKVEAAIHGRQRIASEWIGLGDEELIDLGDVARLTGRSLRSLALSRGLPERAADIHIAMGTRIRRHFPDYGGSLVRPRRLGRTHVWTCVPIPRIAFTAGDPPNRQWADPLVIGTLGIELVVTLRR